MRKTYNGRFTEELGCEEVTIDDLNESHDLWKARKADGLSRRQRKKNRKFGKRFEKFSSSATNVYEFGTPLSLREEKDAVKFLDFYEDWINRVRLPSDYERFVDFANTTFQKEHRRLALSLMATMGNSKASLLNRAYLGLLTKTEFDTYVESQTLVLGFKLSTCGAMFAATCAVGLGVYYTKKIYDKDVKPLLVSAAKSSGTINKILSSTTDVVETVWRWFKEWYKKMKEFVITYAPILRDMVHLLIKMLACVLSFEYVKTAFPTHVGVVTKYMAERIGLTTAEVSPQSGGSPLEDILNFIRVNMTKVSLTTFWSHFEKIPRVVNVAKSIEWILTNMTNLWSTLMEIWSGELRGRNAFERDVLEFVRNVDELKTTITGASVDVIFGTEVALRENVLMAEKKRLESELIRQRSHRPAFSIKLQEAGLRLGTMHTKLVQERNVARPRPVPVWLYIYGVPAVGKSWIMPKLMSDVWLYVDTYGKDIVEKGSKFEQAHCYPKNQDEEFFDGYRGQFFYLIDDLFQSKSSEIRSATAVQLINMIAPTPCALRVATVEDKAHTHFISKCVVTTTNLRTDHFKTDNTNLVDPMALSTRRTVSVEMLSKDKFVLDAFCTTGGTQVLAYDDLVALVGECIIKNSEEMSQVVVPKPVPRFMGNYKAPRCAIGGPIVRTKPLPPLPTATSAPVRPPKPVLSPEMVTKMKDGLLQRPDGSPITALNLTTMDVIYLQGLGKGKEKEEEKSNSGVVAQGKTAFGDVDLSDSEEEIEVETDCDSGEEGEEPAEEKFDEEHGYNEAMAYVKKVRASQSRWKAHCEVLEKEEEEIRSSKVVPKPYVRAKKRTWKEKLRSLWVEDVTIWMSIPLTLTKKLLRKRPGYVLNPFVVEWEGDGFNDFTWTEWIDQHYLSDDIPKDVSEFWQDLLLEWYEEYGRSDDGLERVHCLQDEVHRAGNRMPIAKLLLGATVSIAVVGVGCWAFVQLIMPASAYAQGGVMYEHQQKAKTRRANANRARRRENARAKLIHGTKAQSRSDYTVLARNYEQIEVRVVPKNLPKHKVLETEVLSTSWCLFVYGRTCIIPMHTLYGRGPIDNDHTRYVTFARNQSCTLELSSLTLVSELRGDLGLYRVPEIQERRNILGHFAEDMPTFGRAEHVMPSNGNTYLTVTPAVGWENRSTTVDVSSEYDSFETDVKFLSIPNGPGMCGTAYCHRATGKVFAIHMAGNPMTDVAFGVMLFRGDLSPYLEGYNIAIPLENDMEPAPAVDGLGVLGYVQSQAASFVTKTSRLVQSGYDMGGFPFPPTQDVPAPLVGSMVDGVFKSPLVQALKSFGLQKTVGLGPKPVDTIHDFLPATFDKTQVRMWSKEEAIFGIPGYADSLDLGRSSGYYWKKMGLSRRDLCQLRAGGEKWIHPLLSRAIDQMMDKITSGTMVPSVFEDNLKDEVRDIEKVKAMKTRLYAPQDFTSLIVQRMYLGSFLVETMKDPVYSPISLRINPHSKDWGQLHRRLSDAGPILGAGDFSYYDISLKNALAERFVELVQMVHPRPGEVRLVIMANFYGWHVCGKLVFIRPWGTCSGSLITSVFNTFCNWLLHKQAFVSIYNEVDWKFVQTSFHGDDSLYSTAARFNKYNMEYLSKFFLEEYAMVYTSPSKNDKMSVEWETMTYLKRRFVQGDMGIMAPLDPKSMYNMVAWKDKDSTQDDEYSLFQSSLLESFHHGRKTYDAVRAKVEEWSAGAYELRCFPTYDQAAFVRRRDYQ